jgi:hypothetical protein
MLVILREPIRRQKVPPFIITVYNGRPILPSLVYVRDLVILWVIQVYISRVIANEKVLSETIFIAMME